MQRDFWLNRWRSEQTGFHRSEVMPLLARHWQRLELDQNARVLVPLAGKSLDMIWLADQGYRVLGVELSPRAVAQFLQENQLQAREFESPLGRHFDTGAIELICGDVFDLDKAAIADCSAVYDRAALIALPPDMRRSYSAHLSAILPARCRMLLITLDYVQQQMDGPPFAVGEDEVRELYGKAWHIECLEQRDILDSEPRFAERGLSWLTTAVYDIRRG